MYFEVKWQYGNTNRTLLFIDRYSKKILHTGLNFTIEVLIKHLKKSNIQHASILKVVIASKVCSPFWASHRKIKKYDCTWIPLLHHTLASNICHFTPKCSWRLLVVPWQLQNLLVPRIVKNLRPTKSSRVETKRLRPKLYTIQTIFTIEIIFLTRTSFMLLITGCCKDHVFFDEDGSYRK